MDKNLIVSKLKSELPGSILEIRRFGRSATQSIWIEAQAAQKVAHFLRNAPDLKVNWLENLSVVEFEGALVATYFVRSTTQIDSHFVLRASIALPAATEEVALPSVCSVWPMGEPMEREAAEMFGIRFLPEKLQSVQEEILGRKLPKDWKGFPLRKNYVFPNNLLIPEKSAHD